MKLTGQIATPAFNSPARLARIRARAKAKRRRERRKAARGNYVNMRIRISCSSGESRVNDVVWWIREAEPGDFLVNAASIPGSWLGLWK